VQDKDFIWRCVYLAGQANATAHWMTLQEDQAVKEMGENLKSSADFFFSEVKTDKPPTPART